jgi:hypothetical protein
MKIDARGWVFEISNGAATPTWTQIGGINSFELNPGENSETADTTDFESDGEFEGEAMQRGATLALEGQRKVDDDTPAVVDPGQAAVDLLGTKVSRESLGQIRFRHDTQTAWTIWTAYVVLGSLGGGNNDKTSWSATFTRSGKASTAPVAP